MGTCGTNKPFKERIRHLTPAWHAVNMGTGVISALFHSYPFIGQTREMQYIGLVIFFLNIFLFVVITGAGAARYTFFKSIWSMMLRHPVQSLYLGCMPMGFATLIIAAVDIPFVYFKFGGEAFLNVLWGMWWFDVALALFVCFGQLHHMMTRQSHRLEAMTTVWLLPIVTLIVASSTGAVVAQALLQYNVKKVLVTLAICYTLVVVGITLALMVFSIYLLRLILHGLPEGISIFSAFLPLGPLGQSGFSFLVMGEICRDLFPVKNGGVLFSDPLSPNILYGISWVISFALWSLATAWFLLAVLALADTLTKVHLPFKVTFWGMIFPNGVYANLTIQLGNSIDSNGLRIWGAIYAVFTLILWLFAMGRTLPCVYDGSIFQSPCLEEAELLGSVSPSKPSEPVSAAESGMLVNDTEKKTANTNPESSIRL